MTLNLVRGSLTSDQMAELEHFNDVEGAAANAWKGGQGAKWAARNPIGLAETDASFRERYGVNKSWAVRDVLRDVPRTEGPWLEVGCSAGAHLALMESLGFEMLGAEISFEAMASGQHRGRCVQADARRLPFPDLAFAGVTTAGSFMHLGPPDNMRACARELTRLARGWWLLIELWSPEPHIVSFGDLLPPVWLYPWEVVLPDVLGPEWQVRQNVIRDLRPDYRPGIKAPLSFTLLERVR